MAVRAQAHRGAVPERGPEAAGAGRGGSRHGGTARRPPGGTTGMTGDLPPAALIDAEIREQPDVWRRLLASDQFAAVAGQILAMRPRMVLLAAPVTSDAGAVYAEYLMGGVRD